MRLIFVTDTLSSGGAERVISILANYFSSKITTEIICLRKMEAFYKIVPEVRVLYADDYAKLWLKKMLWLRNYVLQEDIVIPFMVKVYCVTLFSLIGKKIKVIATERNDPKTTGIPWKFLRLFLLPKVNALVVQTQQIKDYFSETIQKKIKIILNPLDLNNCYQGEWDMDSKLVLAVGRTDRQKNYPMMIHAFKRVHDIHPEYKLEIWGNRNISEDGEKIIELINSLGVSDYITIRGRTDDMAGLYGKAYMFVMTSNYEGLSNALIEAICSGLPVISTKVSGATEVINNGENGILVDVGNEKDFCQAMMYYIDKPREAKRMAKNARRGRAFFSKETICYQWEELIASVAKK